ncbi:hypothetical protein C8Q80DRAFT_613111 [Daedaleopsis nitida]|nr:hypothetical protein C8Q80DRAFT_613111 [Daedaleopsis nitida]
MQILSIQRIHHAVGNPNCMANPDTYFEVGCELRCDKAITSSSAAIGIRSSHPRPTLWFGRITYRTLTISPAILASPGPTERASSTELGLRSAAFPKAASDWYSKDKANFQQYTTVPAETAAKIPDKISLGQAASVPFTGIWNYDPQAR